LMDLCGRRTTERVDPWSIHRTSASQRSDEIRTCYTNNNDG
jgi:hypothetical protein